ncbi:MAG: 50S ribosomal protein L28, partial [Patescibacteria group bacterium]
MARTCENCGKGAQSGFAVAGHSKVKTKRRFQLNLHSTRINLNGKIKNLTICTSCLKKFRKAGKIVR